EGNPGRRDTGRRRRRGGPQRARRHVREGSLHHPPALGAYPSHGLRAAAHGTGGAEAPRLTRNPVGRSPTRAVACAITVRIAAPCAVPVAWVILATHPPQKNQRASHQG